MNVSHFFPLERAANEWLSLYVLGCSSLRLILESGFGNEVGPPMRAINGAELCPCSCARSSVKQPQPQS